MKVCTTIQPNKDTEDGEDEAGRSTYSDGVAAKSFKPSSVKQLLVLAACPEVPEEYSNLTAILDELCIECLEFSVSADIKMLLNQLETSQWSPILQHPVSLH